jgi:hypothetical protein
MDRDGPVCRFDGCDRKPLSRGWCGEHYRHWLRTGTPGDAGTPPESTSKKTMLDRLRRVMEGDQ